MSRPMTVAVTPSDPASLIATERYPLDVPDAWVDGLPVDRYTRAMWYRLFLPEVAPDLDRILYLDADTIVVERLDALFATDLFSDVKINFNNGTLAIRVVVKL